MMICPECSGSGNYTVTEKGEIDVTDVGKECPVCEGGGKLTDDGKPLLPTEMKELIRQLKNAGIKEVGEISIYQPDASQMEELEEVPRWAQITVWIMTTVVIFLLGAVATTLLPIITNTVNPFTWQTGLAGGTLTYIYWTITKNAQR